MKETIWVLLACGRLSVGGVQSVLLNYYKSIDRNIVQFAFAVQRDYEMPYDKEILDLGGRIHYIRRMDDSVKGYVMDLCKVIDDHPEYKIIHCHINQKNVIPLLVAAIKKVPIRISHSHNTSPSNMRLLSKIRGFFMRLLIIVLANQKMGCSHAACADLYLNRKDYIVIQNAIDIDRFKFSSETRQRVRESYNIDNNTILLGHVGNFSKQKNPFFLIDIIASLPSQYRLLLVGDGGDKKKIEERVKELELDERVIFTGITNSAPFFQAMDVFLLPSIFEGLGLVCIEAIASGIPVICSNNVPEEIDIVPECYHLPIDKGVECWIKKIQEQNTEKRENNESALNMGGYNIDIEAKKLTEYYRSIEKRLQK